MCVCVYMRARARARARVYVCVCVCAIPHNCKTNAKPFPDLIQPYRSLRGLGVGVGVKEGRRNTPEQQFPSTAACRFHRVGGDLCGVFNVFANPIQAPVLEICSQIRDLFPDSIGVFTFWRDCSNTRDIFPCQSMFPD